MTNISYDPSLLKMVERLIIVLGTLLCYISLLSGLWNIDDWHKYPVSNNRNHLHCPHLSRMDSSVHSKLLGLLKDLGWVVFIWLQIYWESKREPCMCLAQTCPHLLGQVPLHPLQIHSNFLVAFDKVFLEHLQCPSQQPPGLCTWHTASTRPHWTGAGPWAWYTSSKRTWSRLMLSVSRRGGTWCSRVGLAQQPQTPPLPSWSPSALPPPHRLSSRRLQRKEF